MALCSTAQTNSGKVTLAISGVLAFATTCALPNYIADLDATTYTNSVFAFIGFILLFAFYAFTFSKMDKRTVGFSLTLGALFAVATTFGSNLHAIGYPDQPGSAKLGDITTYLNIFCITPFFTAASAWALMLPRHCAERGKNLMPSYRPLPFPITWVLIFVLWIPLFLVVFPGVYGGDSYNEVGQLAGAVPLSSHHPLAHTLLLSGFVLFGNSVFGSQEAGLALYSIFQMIVMSGIFAHTSTWLAKHHVPKSLYIFAIAFFALMPINALYSMSATKDVMFSGFLLLAILALFDAVKDKDAFFTSPKKQVGLAVLLLLVFAFRNNGLYAFVILLPFALFTFRPYLARAALVMLVPIALHLVITGPLYSLAGIEKGSSGEMFSVPLQQISRVINTSSDSLSEEQLEWAEEIVPTWDRYLPRIADPSKVHFDQSAFFENLGDNIKNYFALGLSHPGEFMNQFLDLTYGSWYPGMTFRDPGAYHPYILYDGTYDFVEAEPAVILYTVETGYNADQDWIYRSSFFPDVDAQLADFFYQCKWQQIPVLSMLFSPGFMLWTLVICLAYLLYTKQIKFGIPLAFALMIWVTCLLGPLVQVRYLYILFLILPLELAYLFGGICTTEPRARQAAGKHVKPSFCPFHVKSRKIVR